jgi:hypothetical protein
MLRSNLRAKSRKMLCRGRQILEVMMMMMMVMVMVEEMWSNTNRNLI